MRRSILKNVHCVLRLGTSCPLLPSSQMRHLLPFLLPLLVQVQADCITLKCPNRTGQRISKTPCRNTEPRYYVFNKNVNYGCEPAIDPKCSLPSVTGSGEQLTFCHLPQANVLPKPGIHPEGTHVISVVTSRFFSEPKFKDRHPSNLTLLAKFNLPEDIPCVGVHNIEAERRKNSTECLYKIRISMPGIDHKTDDHYYYDDGTDLETSFSTEMFKGASSVLFWSEVSLQQEVVLSSGTIYFNFVAESPRLRFWFPDTTTPSPARGKTLPENPSRLPK